MSNPIQSPREALEPYPPTVQRKQAAQLQYEALHRIEQCLEAQSIAGTRIIHTSDYIISISEALNVTRTAIYAIRRGEEPPNLRACRALVKWYKLIKKMC